MLTGNPFFDEKSGQFKIFIVEDDTTVEIRDDDFIGQSVKSIPKEGKPRDKTIAVVEWRGTTKKNVEGIIVLCTEDIDGETSTQKSSSKSTSPPNGGDYTLLIEKMNNIESLCEKILEKLEEEEILYEE